MAREVIPLVRFPFHRNNCPDDAGALAKSAGKELPFVATDFIVVPLIPTARRTFMPATDKGVRNSAMFSLVRFYN